MAVIAIVLGSQMVTQVLKAALPRAGDAVGNSLPSGHVTLVVALGVALLVALGLHSLTDSPPWPVAALQAAAITAADVAVFVLLARALRLREVTSVIETVTRRLSRTRAS